MSGAAELLDLPPFAHPPLPRDPSSGRLFVVTDEHGTRSGRHEGVDLATRDARGRPTTGLPVYALWPGVVVDVEQDARAGLYVELENPDGHTLMYAHLSRADVAVGDIVEAGTQLGLSGRSGQVTGPHLHLELRLWGQRPGIDPLPYLEELRTRWGDDDRGAGVELVPVTVSGGLVLAVVLWLLRRRR